MKKIATLSALLLALVVLAGCGKKTTPVTTQQPPAADKNMPPTLTNQSGKNGANPNAGQPAGGDEIDQELKSMDNEVGSINPDDFSENSNPDPELGL